MNIGKFIKNHRKKLNMTQKELAKTLGTHHITVCRWETNFIKPSDQHWIILQNLFGTRKDNLIIPAVSMKPAYIGEINMITFNEFAAKRNRINKDSTDTQPAPQKPVRL